MLRALVPEGWTEDTVRLIDAVKNGRIEEVKGFLDRGASVDTTNAQGDSLLLIAVKEGDPEMVKPLLERGADPLHVGSDGFIVWHWVPFGCSLEITRLLLPLNRHIDMGADNGAPPLWYAGGRNCTEIVEFLLLHSADPNHSSPRGWSLLHYAASLGNEKGARLLLKYGARIDIPNEHGALPYQYVPDDKPELLRVLTPKDGQATAR